MRKKTEELILERVKLIILANGKEKLTMYPNDTWQRIGCIAVYELKPGEELAIICPHGVEGEVKIGRSEKTELSCVKMQDRNLR